MVLTVAMGLLSGCAAPGQVHIAPLNYHQIDPPAPGFTTIQLGECFWWTDESGQVCVAMERHVPSIFGRYAAFRFQMSLELERPPAGAGRNYTVARRELRASARFGPTQNRFTSIAGIVALYTAPGDRLRGSFRIFVSRQVNRLLGGWTRPSGYLMLGQFNATRDEQRGRAIAAATEAHGWQREPRPTSRPAGRTPDVPAHPWRACVSARKFTGRDWR